MKQLIGTENGIFLPSGKEEDTLLIFFFFFLDNGVGVGKGS